MSYIYFIVSYENLVVCQYFLVDEFLYSHHLSVQQFIDIVGRSKILIKLPSVTLKSLAPVLSGFDTPSDSNSSTFSVEYKNIQQPHKQIR